MENSFGVFLRQRRQEKNLTQKELAKLLFVSESAVSKWEKDVARPDIALLPGLSAALGVTEHELITASIDLPMRKEKAQAKKWRTLSLAWQMTFYIAYGIALLVCFICNIAIQHTLDWFWIVLAALSLAFTFTNLPGLIKKNQLFLLPISIFSALCILIAVCAIYRRGDWFWIAFFAMLLAFLMIFVPIYICRYTLFSKIKKYADYVSVFIDFIVLNILLIVIDFYCVRNGYAGSHWYASVALPITLGVYFVLNILLSVRFLKINRFIKTSIILFLTEAFMYIPPLFIKVKNQAVQNEINQLNIFNANFFCWQGDGSIDTNVHCIVALALLLGGTIFLIVGLIRFHKQK